MEEVKDSFRSQMSLMKSDMIAEIVSAIGRIRQHVGIEGSYEEVFEYVEVVGLSCETYWNQDGQFSSPGSQLKLKHNMEVSNFLGTLSAGYLIDWIGELENYFDLQDIEDPLRVRLAQTKFKGHATLWWKDLQSDRGGR